jgi:hypothetical protein
MKQAALVALVLALVCGVCASAQTISSNVQTVALNAVIPESISLDQPTAAVVNFAIQPMSSANTPGDAKPSFNTNYSLKPGRVMTVCAYLSGPLTGATTGNTDTIGTGSVLAQFTSTGNFVAFDGTTACGQSHGLVAQTFTATSVNHTGVVGTTVALAIASFQAKIPDTYTGTLNFVAQAQ